MTTTTGTIVAEHVEQHPAAVILQGVVLDYRLVEAIGQAGMNPNEFISRYISQRFNNNHDLLRDVVREIKRHR